MAGSPAGGKVYPPKADFFGDNGSMTKVGDGPREGTSAGTVPDSHFPPPNLGEIKN